ncbi:hypothetical protein Tco_0603526 [Tanacetum coccineum]
MFKCVRPLAGKTFQKEFRSAGWCKENRDGQKTVAEDNKYHGHSDTLYKPSLAHSSHPSKDSLVYFSTEFNTTLSLSHSELDDIEKVAVRSSL